MLRLKELLVAMGLWVAIGHAPLFAQFSGGAAGPVDRQVPQSIAGLEQSCSGGNAADCDVLGMRHLRGDGTAKDPKKAISYFQRACDRGDALGCYNLGESYRFGDGVPKDPAKAAAFYQRACDGREKNGCSELALSYLGGNGVERSGAKAALYADRACSLNSPVGCAILGMAYADGVEGYPQDLAEAGDLLSNACHQKVDYTKKPDEAARLACPALATVTGEPVCGPIEKAGTASARYCFEERNGAAIWRQTAVQQSAAGDADLAGLKAALDEAERVRAAPVVAASSAVAPAVAALNAGNAAYARKDYAAAAAQFAKACDAGSVEACGSLGEMYATGQGVTANGKIAAPMLAKACDAGFAKACGALGGLYERGNGVTRNSALAFSLYGSACLKSDLLACHNQGRLYDSGEGTGSGKNVSLAAALFEKACSGGIIDSCTIIGSMYEYGIHYARNETTAKSFYTSACNRGSQRGCENAAQLERNQNERRKATEIAALPVTDQKSSKYGRPSCLFLETNHTGGGREFDVATGLFSYPEVVSTTYAINRCKENLIVVDINFYKFMNSERIYSGSRPSYRNFIREISINGSNKYNEEDLYFTKSEWSQVSGRFP